MLKALWSGGRKPQKSPQQQLVSINGLEAIWRRSARRTRSLAMKLDKSGQLILMTPLNTSESELRHFAQSRWPWIEQQLIRHADMAAAMARASGGVWLMGKYLSLESSTGGSRHVIHEAGVLQLISPRELNADQRDLMANAWLRLQAEQQLPQRLTKISEKTGLRGRALEVKAYRARWGSCRHDALIQLNWKLIMAPSQVIDYVIVHELSHLVHFNHSPAFWALVASHCPDFKRQRQWLKENGSLLLARA